MSQGLHHHPHKNISSFDKLMHVVAFLAPLMTVPQFYQIWVHKDASGVSLTTWSAYTISSFLWLIYCREHHEMPILFSQILISLLNVGIVIGILLYK